MATALLDHVPSHPSAKIPSLVQIDVNDRLRRAMCHNARDRRYTDRRHNRRLAYPYPIHLTPVGIDDSTPQGETIIVVGKHLSECGLDFYHNQPLPYRRMIASLRQGETDWMGLLVDLTWCRFTRHGWYENGGRFIEMIRSPMEDLDRHPVVEDLNILGALPVYDETT